MKNFILGALILISVSALCQNIDTAKSFIYKSYDSYLSNNPSVILDHEKGDIIKFTFPAGLQIRLKTKSGEVVTIYKPGDIWGFMQKGELFRYYEPKNQKEVGWEYRLYYKVIYNKEVVVYSVYHDGPMPGDTYTAYYYSADLTSEIKKVTDKNLTSDFSDKPQLVELIKKLTVK